MGNTTNTRTLTNLIDEIPYELFIHIMEYYDIRIIYLIGNIGKINPIILSYMKNNIMIIMIIYLIIYTEVLIIVDMN